MSEDPFTRQKRLFAEKHGFASWQEWQRHEWFRGRVPIKQNIAKTFDKNSHVVQNLESVFQQIDQIRAKPYGFVYSEEHPDTP